VGTLQQVYRLTNHRVSSSSGFAHSPIVSFELLDITGSRFAIFYGLAAVKTALRWPSLRLAAGPARLAA
jgi:hypothetical protein